VGLSETYLGWFKASQIRLTNLYEGRSADEFLTKDPGSFVECVYVILNERSDVKNLLESWPESGVDG